MRLPFGALSESKSRTEPQLHGTTIDEKIEQRRALKGKGKGDEEDESEEEADEFEAGTYA